MGRGGNHQKLSIHKLWLGNVQPPQYIMMMVACAGGTSSILFVCEGERLNI